MLLGDQVYADETPDKIRRLAQAPARAPPPRRTGDPGGRLRRVHEALPGLVDRPGDPLAALLRAERDDLRRPRDHRRLEHAPPPGARRSCRAALVARADRRPGSRSYWVYQHLGNLAPRRAGRGPGLRRGGLDRRRHRGPGRLRHAGRQRPRLRTAGVSPSTSTGPASWCSTTAPDRELTPGHRSMLPESEWQWLSSTVRRRVRPPGRRLVAAVADAAGDPPPRGDRASGSPTRPGGSWPVWPSDPAGPRPGALGVVRALVRRR